MLGGKYLLGRKSLLLSFVVVVAVIASVMLLAALSRAAGGSHYEVIATGLDNPRGPILAPTGHFTLLKQVVVVTALVLPDPKSRKIWVKQVPTLGSWLK